MNFTHFIGIDISKNSFDYTVLNDQEKVLEKGKVDNTLAAIKKWKASLKKSFGSDFLERTLFCLENTGIYCLPFLKVIGEDKEANIWLENALQIKRSIGVTRGKSDEVDAARIARYALLFHKEAKLWVANQDHMDRLAILISTRDRLVKNLGSIKVGAKEGKGFLENELYEEIREVNLPIIQSMEQAIKEVDRKIEQIIKEDDSLKRQSEIIQSIPGFGKVIAPKIIIATKGFTKITDPRKLACFAGVAPFPYSSGTSIKGKNKVSHLANKDLKKMLHLAALSSITTRGFMRKYFERKVEEGKNKMSIINAVRNKLIHILMACIKKDTTYQRNYQHSLV